MRSLLDNPYKINLLLNGLGLLGSKYEGQADRYRQGISQGLLTRAAAQDKKAEAEAEREYQRQLLADQRAYDAPFRQSQIDFNNARAVAEGVRPGMFGGNSQFALQGRIITQIGAKIARGEPLTHQERLAYQTAKAHMARQQTFTDQSGNVHTIMPMDTGFMPQISAANTPVAPMMDAINPGIPVVSAMPEVPPVAESTVVAPAKTEEEKRKEDNLRRIDTEFSKTVNKWVTTDGPNARSNVASLQKVLDGLLSGEVVTGDMRQLGLDILPDKVAATFAPSRYDAQEIIDSVTQGSIKQVLDAQFGQREAEMILSRAYNKNLPPEMNANRLAKVMLKLRSLIDVKDAQAKYFQENGTLEGFTGEMPSFEDFLAIDYGSDELTDQEKRIKELEEKLGLQ